MDFRLSTSEPFDGGTIQIRVRIIGLVYFEYAYILVYLSIISECPLFMKAPVHNRVLRHEEEMEDAGGVPLAFDFNTRVGLHQLYTLVSARYKVITLATHYSPASERLRTLVFGHGDHDAY